jgi:hypothetical protein
MRFRLRNTGVSDYFGLKKCPLGSIWTLHCASHFDSSHNETIYFGSKRVAKLK